MEYEGKIGEWQCGFRPGYRLDDHLFLITQAVEVSRATGMGCMGLS